jgi:hypothetical protein
MTIALVLFALAAVGGLVMAIQRFSGKPVPPLPLALVHGAAAASGLVALIVVVSNGAVGGAKIALVLFAGAALGGFYLFSRHLRQVALPIPIVVVHALVAVAGFVTLLVSVMG